MKYIKGFDENLTCRGFQFEVGKIYDTGHSEYLEICSNTVFHFCENIRDVHKYYDCGRNGNRYCEIEVLGGLVAKGDKCGSNKIKIVREIVGEELNELMYKTRGNTGVFNTGHYNTGHCNTGYYNAGNYNTGDYNTGDYNTGYCNTGYCNTGNHNTRNYNTGNYNTGNFNTSDYNTGFFNIENHTIKIFDCDSGLTMGGVMQTKWYKVLSANEICMTDWVYYTDEEKENSPIRQAIGGYLKKYTFKEACLNWWNSLSEEKKELIKTIPNFNKDKFKEITGIEI